MSRQLQGIKLLQIILHGPQHTKINRERLSHPKNAVKKKPSAQINPKALSTKQKLVEEAHQQKKKVDLPSRPLTMIPHIISRIRMDQRAQRPPPNHQPTDKSPKLLRRENIHLEHPDRVRAYRSLHQRVDPQFGELAPDPLVQFAGVLDLGVRGLLEVDVDVEAATGGVGYGVGEGGVGGGYFGLGLGVDEGFGVGACCFLGAVGGWF